MPCIEPFGSNNAVEMSSADWANRFSDSQNYGRLKKLALCVGLAVFTVAIYWPVRHFPFINYDDNFYVTENAIVQKGLTVEGLKLALRGVHASNWHPVTTVSHLIDCQLFGLNAGPPHLENVL